MDVDVSNIDWDGLLVAHDAHPQYASSRCMRWKLAAEMQRLAVQHHRAHVASVLAERGAWEKRVVGVSFDGTGYGDDGSIWGGELFAGSIEQGFERVAHLRSADLPGGDGAARYPVQAAAGFLGADTWACRISTAEPFRFPARYHTSTELIRKGVRTFSTTSVGRLFDAAAALLGFTREIDVSKDRPRCGWNIWLASRRPPPPIRFRLSMASWISGRYWELWPGIAAAAGT